MKYIDADKLKAEIEKRAKFHDDAIKACVGLNDIAITHSAGWKEDTELLAIISSLQQEQPEVDLDFQVFAKEMDAVFNLSKEVTENTKENPLNWEYAIARHFYSLGLNAKK